MLGFLAGACLLLPGSAAGTDLANTPGITAERPATGRFVPLEKGYMIPYKATIPGTDVVIEMVPIPGGSFLQGSPDMEADRSADEGPQVKVEVPPFWMGKYEVTWAEYKIFMSLCGVFESFEDQNIRRVTKTNQVDAITAPSKLYEPSFTFSGGEDPRQPAVTMSQFAAKQYTKWLSLLTGQFYRLPSESEWEYACRAGSTTAYSYGESGEELDKFAWYFDNADDKTHRVGSKQPNVWGLYDMHGNASEWVLDQYEAAWYGKIVDQPVSSEKTLSWPEKLYPRVLRGGSWNLDPKDCRSAARRASNDDELRSYDPNTPKSPWWFASDSAQDIGFRIVRPLDELPRAERERYWEPDIRDLSRVVNQRIYQEGRGKHGLVDPDLPQAITNLYKLEKE